jgi:hypothetical protein
MDPTRTPHPDARTPRQLPQPVPIGERVRLALVDAERSREVLHASVEKLRATVERVQLMADGYSPDPA